MVTVDLRTTLRQSRRLVSSGKVIEPNRSNPKKPVMRRVMKSSLSCEEIEPFMEKWSIAVLILSMVKAGFLFCGVPRMRIQPRSVRRTSGD